MIELRIHKDYMTQIRIFLTNQKVQLVIYVYNNKRREIEIKISQKS